MYSDGDGFNPGGVIKYIVTVLIGIILISLFVGVTIDLVYDVDIEEDNGDGLGVPMSSASDKTYADLNFIKTDSGVKVSGAYSGLVRASNIVLVLANDQSVYVRNGDLHYYNGYMDVILNELPMNISHGKLNNLPFEWLYYPNTQGAYRAYDGSVDYDVNERVAGIGTYSDSVIISMNDTVTSNNSGQDVFVYIDRSEEGIEGIYYRWE